MTLVYTGSEVSTLTEGFCLELRLKILPLGILLHLEETWGISILQKGYIEANLIIPGFHQYNDDVLLLIVSHHNYGEWVPVQLGSLVIDHLVVTMTTEKISAGL